MHEDWKEKEMLSEPETSESKKERSYDLPLLVKELRLEDPTVTQVQV